MSYKWEPTENPNAYLVKIDGEDVWHRVALRAGQDRDEGILEFIAFHQAPDPGVPLDVQKTSKGEAAQAQFAGRALAVASPNGPQNIDRLNAWVSKRSYRKAKGSLSAGDEAKMDQIEVLNDKLDLLLDAIEAAADQAALDAIDVTDNSWWV